MMIRLIPEQSYLLADREVLLIDLTPDVILQFQESRTHLGLLIAGIGDVDVHNLLDTAGAGTHDDHPLGQNDGLLYVVGDEEAGLLLLLPGVEQLLLELGTGLCVQGAKASSISSTLGLTA